MFKVVIVPLDGSALGEQALPRAGAIAERLGVTLDLVRVHLGPESGSWEPGMPENLARVDERSYLCEMANALTARLRVGVSHSLLSGDVVAAIAAHVEEADAPLVVMSSHGRTGVVRAWLGSVADGLVRRGGAPVLIVRAQTSAPTATIHAGMAPFTRVLVPLDGSERAESIVAPALAIVAPTATVHLVRVVERGAFGELPYPFSAPAAVQAAEAIEEMLTRATEYLDGLAASLRTGSSLDVTTEVRVASGVGHAVLETAEAVRPDLIAIATHGRGRSRLVLGSVTDKLLRGTTAAVLVRAAASPAIDARVPAFRTHQPQT